MPGQGNVHILSQFSATGSIEPMGAGLYTVHKTVKHKINIRLIKIVINSRHMNKAV